MYIRTIKINNFKAIDELTINFKPGINILIGNNGVGKTSVLEAVAVALSGYISGIPDIKPINIRKDDIHINVKRIGDASIMTEYCTPSSVSCKMSIDGKEVEWTRSRKDEDSGSKTSMDNKSIRAMARKASNDSEKRLPLFSFQSEARAWQVKRSDYAREAGKKLNDRRRGYIGCLDYALDINSIKRWCLKMEMEAFNRQSKIREYELFKAFVGKFMEKMNDLRRAPQLYYSTQLKDLVYVEDNNIFPVSILSAGYQSLLWMAMDFAYRAALLNPDINSISNIDGVILIDEIDMHLHPQWQWKVASVFSELLPNVQFIIATHSPIIISSCKNASLISLQDKDNVIYKPDAYGLSVQNVLELRQSSKGSPAKLLDMLARYDALLNKEDYDAARTLLDEMIHEYGEDNEDVRTAIFEMELNGTYED